jgi:predicted phage-related endonuclease
MRYGSYFEDYVAMLYSEQTGRTVQRYNKMIHRGCLLGNFDRLVVPEGGKVASHMGEIRTNTLLECKTAVRDWGDEVPIQYQCQVSHYLGLSEALEYADVAVLFRTSLDFRIYRVERDDEAIKVMQERLAAWWEEYVVGDKMPPPTNEEDCRKLWARSNPGKQATASDEVADAVKRYLDAQASEKASKEIAAGLRGDICAAMGDAEILVDAAGRPLVTWKSAKDSAKTDWEGLARRLGATPEQIAEATQTTPGARRFVIKAKADTKAA